jgi:hypothetical protein
MWVPLLVAASGLVLLAMVGTEAVRWLRGRGSGAVPVSAPALAFFNQALAQSSERSPFVTENATSAPTEGGEYAEVGKRVIGILEAAEVAATQIRAEAIEAAAQIRKAAEAEAGVTRLKSEEEAARTLSDAEAGVVEIRAAAETAAAARRDEAEEEVKGIVEAAETRALEIRRSAEEEAKQIEAVARARDELLHEQVRPLEENLRRALEAFRGISGQLEELLADLPKAAEESLADTLQESAAAQVEARR